MEKIIPRWEYRVFGESFGEAEDNIRAHEMTRELESSETYVLSTKSGNNVKVRDGKLDIKTLQNTNEDTLEQWMPVLKVGFPAPAEEVRKIFDALDVTDPGLDQDEYSFEEFVGGIVGNHEDLQAVDVFKHRYGYMINDTIVELADLTFNGKPIRTAAVEHIDPELVMSTIRELGLSGFENVNYIKSMKRVTGQKEAV